VFQGLRRGAVTVTKTSTEAEALEKGVSIVS